MKKNLLLVLFSTLALNTYATTYYVSSSIGNDDNEGTSLLKPFKTLSRLKDINIMAGDSILLHSEGIHEGGLYLHNVAGRAGKPIVISAYDTTPGRRNVAHIDASTVCAGIFLENCSFIDVSRLHISARGGNIDARTKKEKMRCGILCLVTKPGKFNHIRLQQLRLNDIFYNEEGLNRGADEVRTATGTQTYGWGIRFINRCKTATLENLTVTNCIIENVAHTGIKLSAPNHSINHYAISYNTILRTGGPGMQVSGGDNGHINGNYVAYSGSEDDSRKWGRGSGLWTWGCKNVLIEKNHFLYANGPGDSAGAHIDFNCTNVIMQYNLSAYNAGGFCEILGNNHNCMYRYNISINDGYRKKKVGGAFQEGKILWTSGFVGKNVKRHGPYNAYIYNNTIFTDSSSEANVAICNTTRGLWIANNIIYTKGGLKSVLGDQYKAEKKGESEATGVKIVNNLFKCIQDWNKAISFANENGISGNPGFASEGSLQPEDYVPSNVNLVKDKGVLVPLPEGVAPITKDFFGNPIIGNPDLGAIECLTKE